METEDFFASFGVGCFHFHSDANLLDGLTNLEEYRKNLEKHLKAYPHVISVTFESDHLAQRQAMPLDEDGGIQSASGISPWLVDFEYAIELDIPDRFQSDILEAIGINRKPETTRYRARFFYNSELPVCIVEGVNVALKIPSQAVILVREYLKKHAPNGGELKICFVGPSPFHADFYVSTEAQEDCDIELQPGYARVVFGTLGAPDTQLTLSSIHAQTALELSHFYRVIQARNRIDELWSNLAVDVRKYTDQALTSRWGWIKRLNPAHGSAASMILLQIVDLELELETLVSDVRRGLADVRDRYGLDRFRSFTEDELKQILETPIEKYKGIMSIVERRQNVMEGNQVVVLAAAIGLISAIIGGVIGGLVGGGG